jgi:hypothetical protein
MDAATLVATLRKAGVSLFRTGKPFYGDLPTRLRIVSKRSLAPHQLQQIRNNKKALIAYMYEPASEDERAAVAATGRNPSDLTHAEAWEFALLPPLPPYTEWELAVDGYYQGLDGFKPAPWTRMRATDAQRNYVESLTGITPPASATKGECSWVIGWAKDAERRKYEERWERKLNSAA